MTDCKWIALLIPVIPCEVPFDKGNYYKASNGKFGIIHFPKHNMAIIKKYGIALKEMAESESKEYPDSVLIEVTGKYMFNISDIDKYS